MSSKLQSLQGLRGISILLVLVFHLFPKYFVNGFVGVDMFFVLSGYLMTRILSKEFTVSSVVNFYKKRFSRIVPLYYFTIFFTLLGVLSLVLKSERTEFILDVKWCLALISNYQPIFEHHSYWDQVSTIRFLTHLWSLATELQYYLIVPIIHLVASNLPFVNRITGYLIAIIILFFFQLLTPFELSYCFLAARVWQFLLGSVAFEMSQRNDLVLDFHTEKKNAKTDFNIYDVIPHIFLAVLFTIIMLPWIFQEHSARLVMSLSAAMLCYSCEKLEQSFLAFQPLVFIGDISYVTYLIHWPVINFVRFAKNFEFSEALIAVIIILVLSLLAHYKLERKLLELEFSVNFTITVFVIGISIALIPCLIRMECLAMKTLLKDLQEKAKFNLIEENVLKPVFELECDFNETTIDIPIDKFGIEYCAHRSNGTGKIMIIGNSLSIRAFPTIYKLFDGQYEEIRLFAKHGGAPLLDIFPYYNYVVMDMAQEMKPDLIWIIQGMNEILFGSDNNGNFSSPVMDRNVPRILKEFEKLAKMVYVDLPYYITKDMPSKLIARSLIYRKSLERLSVTLEDVEKQVEEQTDRLMNTNCSICYYNDVQKALINDQDKLYLYEKDTYKALSYDGSHLALAGYKYIEPMYQRRINQFYEMLGSEELF
ncbi:hypothetical protein B9Z55_016751 [Caenorhabditis nigoni]|uniref:Acyl_transf_3 domain-containing protein n=1 Tax=Caenorhabditis nigoni TaxID=1611254 RepID=A0A2G5T6L9_9PELO|nr:hypothetical protein B9Z55_016751 [Caenorhabditis nigoni]